MSWKHLGFVNQAKELERRIGKALLAIRDNDGIGEKPEESEVAFRLSSIQGVLIMCRLDVAAMVKEWESDESPAKKRSATT